MQSKINSFFIVLFQYVLFILFYLLALGSFTGGKHLPAYIILAGGAFIFPPVRKYILGFYPKAGPIMNVLIGFLLFLSVNVNDQQKLYQKQQKTDAQQQQEALTLHAEYKENPQKVIEDISGMIKEGRMWEAQNKAEMLLNTKNPEIIKLYASAHEAYQGLAAKTAEERQAKEKEYAQKQSLNTSAAYSESDSRELCNAQIRRSANNPSTVNIHSFLGYATDVQSTGVRRITQSFSAKNAFGLEKTYDALCLINPKGEINMVIREQGQE